MHWHVDAICQSLHLRLYWASPRHATYRLENARPTACEFRIARGSCRILPLPRNEIRARSCDVGDSNSRYSTLQVSRRSNEHATREKGTVSSFKFLLQVVICRENEREREREDRVCLPSHHRDFDGFHPRGDTRSRSISMHVVSHRAGRAAFNNAAEDSSHPRRASGSSLSLSLAVGDIFAVFACSIATRSAPQAGP